MKLDEQVRNHRAARLDGVWESSGDVLEIPIRFQGGAFAPVEEALINEVLHVMSLYVEGCISFVDDTTAKERFPYVYVRRYDSQGGYDPGCWSYVGNVHDHSQSLNLGHGCMTKRTIQHEFLHALGFFHEHTRPDRDDYIKGRWFLKLDLKITNKITN